jgi:hypothetical protein
VKNPDGAELIPPAADRIVAGELSVEARDDEAE